MFENWSKSISFMKGGREDILGYYIYELIDLESGKQVKGSAAALSKLVNVPKRMVSHLAKEDRAYKGRYYFRMLGNKQMICQKVYQEWDEMHQVYLELIAGKRDIQRAADGKRYAVRVL